MGGRTCRSTAALFGVSVASVVKWSQRFRATGSAAAKAMGGRRPRILTGERGWLLARIAQKPDLTLRAVVAELADRGIAVSYGALWAFVAREGITFKKSLFAAEQDRPDVARRRRRWKEHQGRLDPRRLVFIDETWAKTNMTRRRGWCARGSRLVAKVPYGGWRTLTFLAALRCDRVQIGRIARQEEQFGAGGADQASDGLAFVAAQIVHDDDVAGSERGHEELLDIGAKPIREPSSKPGNRSAPCSIASPPRNVPTTSSTPAMLPPKSITL
jgi:transposase